MVTLYGIRNCDSIKKTRRWLEQHDIDYEFYDYKKSGCPSKLITRFLKHFSHEQLINRRGTTWRQLPQSARDNLDKTSAITLMQQQPSLIKRPLLEIDSQWLLGFDVLRLAELLDTAD
jgi:arsenate reductase (glutaredoxin)